MTGSRLSRTALALLTAASALAFGGAAYADGTGPRHTQTALDALLADVEMPSPAAEPDRKDPWTAEVEEEEFRDAPFISFSEVLPQGRGAADKRPFIDFSGFELGGFVGLVKYSSAFKANANGVAAITARVPVPGLPGEWGIWAEFVVSYIDRKLPFYYQDSSGFWYGLAVGGDFTFVRKEIWYLRAQLGVLYAKWNGIQALDDGIGALAGFQAGFYWIRGNNKAVVTLTPQLSYDGDSYIFFMSVGFSVDF